MTTTTYYNLNIVEGTDIVNPLIVDNPNYEKIDETMHNNAVAGVTIATEITNATVHAITRENSDCAVIRFIATSQWKAGDTATVDGVPVTALLPSGETLPDGAYVINANVLCILTGTNLTIYAERNKAENANEIPFNDTTVGAELVRQNEEIVRLDGEIDNVNSNLHQVINNIHTELISITSGNNNLLSSITIPKSGIYTLIGFITFTNNTSGYRFTQVKINGTASYSDSRLPINANTFVPLNLSGWYDAGDIIEIYAVQTSGTNIDCKLSLISK